MNRHWVGRALLLGIAVGVAFAAADARAEGFIDVYLGGALTVDSTTDTDGTSLIGSVAGETKTSYADSVSGGVRGGYWIDPLPWIGVAGDISAFGPAEDERRNPTELTVIPISLLLMLRAPLFPADHAPHGRLQPYVAGGPSLFVSQATDEAVIIGTSDLSSLGTFRDVATDFGFDVRAGLKVIAAENFGLFVEYRFTKFDPDYEDTLKGAGTFEVDVKIDPSRIDTHHVNVGVSIPF